jgi:hypothetical protein
MVRLIAILTFPLAILAITAPELVPWLFGSEWTPAVVPMQILAVGGASTLVIDAVGVALMASGRPRALLGFGFGHFGVYAGAVLLATPWGLAGVAGAPRSSTPRSWSWPTGSWFAGPTRLGHHAGRRRAGDRWLAGLLPWRCRSASGSRLPAPRPSCSSWLSRSSGSATR